VVLVDAIPLHECDLLGEDSGTRLVPRLLLTGMIRLGSLNVVADDLA